MLTKKIDETTYKIELYDWDIRHEDYLAGYVKRDPSDEDNDANYWRFYPCDGLAPLSAGDLKRLSTFIINLNIQQSEVLYSSVGVGDHVPSAPLVVEHNMNEIFRVTSKGDIKASGKVITNDNDALADCFRRWVSLYVEKVKNSSGDDL